MFQIYVCVKNDDIVLKNHAIHNSFITGIFFQMKIALCKISCAKKSNNFFKEKIAILNNDRNVISFYLCRPKKIRNYRWQI